MLRSPASVPDADPRVIDPFPRLRWAAPAWLAVWFPAYAWNWGFANFLNLCDLALILTCLGFFASSPLLLSSQAVSSLVVDALWTLDVVWRLILGRHLIGGTEYMWDERFPLALRLLSLFHVGLPPLLLWTLRRVGYDRRALLLQSAIAAVVIPLARLAGPEANTNFSHTAPLLHRPLGPPALHLVLTLAILVFVIYLPTHLLLARLYRPSAPAKA